MNIKKIALLLLIVVILSTSMMLIKRLIPGPENTIRALVKGLEKKDSGKIKDCFTGPALEYVEKKLEGKKGKVLLWAFKDYFKDIIWQIESKEKIDRGSISCLIAAAGGKEERWDFYEEVVFTKSGWDWKISKIPVLEKK